MTVDIGLIEVEAEYDRTGTMIVMYNDQDVTDLVASIPGAHDHIEEEFQKVIDEENFASKMEDACESY